MNDFNATDNIIKKHKMLRTKYAFEDMYFKPAFAQFGNLRMMITLKKNNKM
jgi:hypothetical protein